MAVTSRLARQQLMSSRAAQLSNMTHFNSEECRALIYIYDQMDEIGKIDRARFREILRTTLNITNDVMLDLTFHGFDRDNDGIVDQTEWIKGLSVMIRGTPEEIIEFVYFIYDMNGDRSLAREELYQCLKGCVMPGFAVEADEIEEAEKEIVEIAMRKLDKDRDGQITFPDFQQAVHEDPLLLQACGPCLPSPNAMATFMAVVSEYYRNYTPEWGNTWTRASTAHQNSRPPSNSISFFEHTISRTGSREDRDGRRLSPYSEAENGGVTNNSQGNLMHPNQSVKTLHQGLNPKASVASPPPSKNSD